jgi:hypothetical protein
MKAAGSKRFRFDPIPVIVLASLAGAGSAYSGDAHNSPSSDLPSAPDACLQRGGLWGKLSARPEAKHHCLLPTWDAGQSCQSGEECENLCVTNEAAEQGSQVRGVCFAWSSPISQCLNIVEDGFAQGIQCYD